MISIKEPLLNSNLKITENLIFEAKICFIEKIEKFSLKISQNIENSLLGIIFMDENNFNYTVKLFNINYDNVIFESQNCINTLNKRKINLEEKEYNFNNEINLNIYNNCICGKTFANDSIPNNNDISVDNTKFSEEVNIEAGSIINYFEISENLIIYSLFLDENIFRSYIKYKLYLI